MNQTYSIPGMPMKEVESNKTPAGTCSAGVPPAVSGASRPRFSEITIHDRGRLPHWEKESGTYFITFRLADSMPASLLETIVSERSSILRTAAQLKRELSPSEHKRLLELSTAKIEDYLDQGAGACVLNNPLIGTEVSQCLAHFDEKRYRLFAWCVMPNHVHVVARLFPSYDLPSVLHSWKSLSAKKANGILGKKGQFWQREYYDHLLRDETEFGRALTYTVENPAKAGLRDWPWVYLRGQDAPATAVEDGSATKPAA